MTRPAAIVFDVNETLSDLGPMAARFADVGLPGALAQTWFASVLRDGFALGVVGSAAAFRDVAEAVLRTLLAGRPGDPDEAVATVLDGFAQLPVHPDVPDGLRALHEDGHRLVTLSNGAASVADTLLSRHGLRELVEQVLSVEDAGAWKPARRAYEHAARACAADTSELLLVAVHPWDLDGAARAGLQTVWVDRAGSPYPAHFTPPTHTVGALGDLAAVLRAAG